MNSSRFSKLIAFLLVATIADATAAPAAAVSVAEEQVPSEAKSGSEVTATFTVTDLYTDYEEWTLNGTTELQSVTWTVTLYDQADNKIEQVDIDGQSFETGISVDDDVNKVDVKVRGTAPEVENYSYDPAQSFLLAEFNQVRQGGTNTKLDSWSVHHYTDESATARSAIEDAESAIQTAKSSGASVTDAENKLSDAVSAYEGENFELAGSLADETKNEATSAKKSSEQGQMLMFAGIGLVGLLVVGGGIFWYRSQQDDYDKLR